MSHPDHPATVSCFRDAVGIALQLSEEYAYAQVAVLLDGDGSPLDRRVFDAVGVGLMPVLAWCLSTAADLDPPIDVLLLTARSIEPALVREQDLAQYRRAERTLTGANLGLLDWIETDGELVRSFAYLIHPDTAWITDPVDHRRVDRD
jgi:hypothetical protein